MIAPPEDIEVSLGNTLFLTCSTNKIAKSRAVLCMYIYNIGAEHDGSDLVQGVDPLRV